MSPAGIKFNWPVEHPLHGERVAIGRQELFALDDGTVQVSIVNVLQFPPPRWAIEEDAGPGE